MLATTPNNVDKKLTMERLANNRSLLLRVFLSGFFCIIQNSIIFDTKLIPRMMSKRTSITLMFSSGSIGKRNHANEKYLEELATFPKSEDIVVFVPVI
jgi:hypothetical protein